MLEKVTRTPQNLDQPLLESVTGRLGSVGGADFFINIGHVPSRSAFGNDQLFDYLQVGLASGDEPQHLNLSVSQPIWVARGWRRPGPGQF